MNFPKYLLMTFMTVFALIGLLVPISNAVTDSFTITIQVSTGGNAFSLPTSDVIHYIAPASSPPSGWSAGSDSNNGTSQTTPWATVNHALNCGDVIVAAKGTYNGDFATWGAVSNCPSTTGGIDGTGGISFAILLCGGTDLGTNGCNINCSTAVCNGGHVGSGGRGATSACMNIGTNYWAVISWTCNGNGNQSRGFQLDACLTTSTVVHHVAFVNDIVTNAGQGYDTDDCGYGASPTDTNGGDYFATVGSIAQNAAQDAICLGAIDVVSPGIFDATAGTHFFVSGNFSYANQNPICRIHSDTEDFLIDSPDNHNVETQFVFTNNMGWSGDRHCLNVEEQSQHADTIPIHIENFTCYRNNLFTGTDFIDGEITINPSAENPPSYQYTITNNIAYQPLASNGSANTENEITVLSATYNSTTGILAETFSSAPFGAAITAGGVIRTGGFAGTGSVGSLTGNWPVSSVSGSGTVLNLQAPTGLGTMTLTNSTGIIISGGYYVSSSGVLILPFSSAPAGASPSGNFTVSGVYGGTSTNDGLTLLPTLSGTYTLTASSGSGTIITLAATSGLGTNISIGSASLSGNAGLAGQSVNAFIYGPNVAASGTYTNTTNVFKGNMSACLLSFCDTGDNTGANGTSAMLGTSQTFTSPAYTNTTDLLANWVGAPNCNGFDMVTKCMGWNYSTSTLTSATPISDLTPTTGGMSSQGYQLPGSCASSGEVYTDFPLWMKGLILLQWGGGTTLTENPGLLTIRCGY
jgi:hypothetical protein